MSLVAANSVFRSLTTPANSINPILREFIFRVENQCSHEEPLSADEFQPSMLTPFSEVLARFGFDRFKDPDSEESSEYELISSH